MPALILAFILAASFVFPHEAATVRTVVIDAITGVGELVFDLVVGTARVVADRLVRLL